MEDYTPTPEARAAARILSRSANAARTRKLSPERRREIALAAINIRWARKRERDAAQAGKESPAAK